ncbi:MAG: UPF0262 family protein [Rhodospirillaceae bacterium]|nr:UPF0262 family protein [Rhodospirillaceae bacterium]MYF86290.1 UPF0262 family protein [Rhodospirillaceae bacterium]MYH37257.1 UPF0262 family protein [Rhodospirillaceae bacterium]MYK14904.1 UPF0262 family protein [Rhodospirillaceae bacterium]
MAENARLADIRLDERTVVRRNADIEHERAVAIYDLLEENSFVPAVEADGPYKLVLSVSENRLLFDIRGSDDGALTVVPLALQPFKRTVKDYFTVCESYFAAIKTASPSKIEAIDMGRRALHNEGSELLLSQLKGRIEMDFDTARRLFTLLCVLHLKA